MKLSPSVYVQAARRLQDGRNNYACSAIARVIWRGEAFTPRRSLTHQHEFQRLFKPMRGHSPFYWGAAPGNPGARDCRILALLFMAAIARTETF